MYCCKMSNIVYGYLEYFGVSIKVQAHMRSVRRKNNLLIAATSVMILITLLRFH